MNKNGNSAIFFSYGKFFSKRQKIKELFAPTLDRIPIGVRCVSSMIVVLNAKVALLSICGARKQIR